jgi:tetratricopeptide (TPR) repeat protein
MNNKFGPFSVALLNLTGLGLGYFQIKRHLRGTFHIIGTIALFTLAALTRAAYSPRLWLIILGTWWLWMFIDGWLQAWKYVKVASSTVPVPSPAFMFITRAIIAAEILGIISFQLAGYLEFNAGVKAFESLEFSKAQQYFKRISQYYQLTLNPNVIGTEHYLGETALLIDAERHRQRSQFEESIDAYETHLSTYPSSSVIDFVRQQTIESFLTWSSQLHTTGDFEASINKYETVSKKYSANVDKQAIAEKVVNVYFDWAEALRREKNFEDAFQKYDNVQKDYPASSSISQIKSIRADTYTEWINHLRSTHEYTKAIGQCQAFSNEYPDLYNPEDLHKEIASLYREGAEYERSTARFDSAIDKYTKLMNDYADTEAAEGIDEMTLAQTYVECGDSLQGQKKYIKSMDCYSRVKETTKDKELNKTAQTGYEAP